MCCRAQSSLGKCPVNGGRGRERGREEPVLRVFFSPLSHLHLGPIPCDGTFKISHCSQPSWETPSQMQMHTERCCSTLLGMSLSNHTTRISHHYDTEYTAKLFLSLVLNRTIYDSTIYDLNIFVYDWSWQRLLI